jgi:hypothetical protein
MAQLLGVGAGVGAGVSAGVPVGRLVGGAADSVRATGATVQGQVSGAARAGLAAQADARAGVATDAEADATIDADARARGRTRIDAAEQADAVQVREDARVRTDIALPQPQVGVRGSAAGTLRLR